jgi:hypothetical protein
MARRTETYDDDFERDETNADLRPTLTMTQQALDWGISGSMLAVLILTVVYTLAPADFLSDMLPAATVDEVAAILAGAGAIAFLAVMRYILQTRVGPLGCLLVIVLTSIGAFAIFWGLMRLFDSIL